MKSKWAKALLCLIFLPVFVSAQRLTGYVVDSEGQPVSNASIYIREISLGLVADEKGEFRTQTGKGDYTLEVSSMGYEKKIVSANVPEKGLELKIELHNKIYELQEVVVTKGGEDPAYRIMRNLIARTPYFHRQVKSYESDIYIKGSFKIEKIPKLMTIGADRKKIDLLIGKLFVLESQNKVNYTQPDKYEQHVVATKSSIPAEVNFNDNLPLSIVTFSIYAPGAFGGLLSPSSFSVYKFSLEDSYIENGHTVHKIKIIPRKNNRKLVNGYLYVVENTWNIQRANIIENEIPGMTVNYSLTYHEVKTGAFLPTSYDMSLNLSLLGAKGYGKFYCSIQYGRVETNDFLKAQKNEDAKAQKNERAKEQVNRQKNLKKLEELAGKEKLTTGEVRKMSKLIAKTTETEEERREKRKLEITPLDSMISVTRDTLARLRDTSFWEMTRRTPLSIEELQSYIRRDSLKTVSDSLKQADSIADKKAGGWLISMLFGGNRSIGKKVKIGFEGIRSVCPEFNFADGYWLGQKMEARVNLDDNKSIKFTPSVYYATARKTVVWKTDVSLAYAPLQNGRLLVSAGNTSADYAGIYGTNRFINAVASLLFAENTAKFYQDKFAAVSNSIDVANGLRFHTEFYYAHRNELTNNISHSYFGRVPASNLPYGYTDAVMPPHNTFSANFSLQYRPRFYYYVRKGRKHYSHSSFPTFLLGYKKAFAGNSPVNPSYERVELSVNQQIDIDIFNRLVYAVNAGSYLNRTMTYLPDYRHFNTSELFITEKPLYHSFALLDNYRYATNRQWLQAHVSYNSDYILLNRISLLQKYMMSESVHLKMLLQPDVNHFEAGYSVGLGRFGRVGVFVGFDNWNYSKTGITVSLPLLDF